jgi:RNA polymerase sigma-70 factor (ECF subfamily)
MSSSSRALAPSWLRAFRWLDDQTAIPPKWFTQPKNGCKKKCLLNLFAGQVVQSIEPRSVQESTTRVEDARNNDVELVRRAAGGDVAAYEQLYREHVGQVFGLCLRMTRDRGEAEEMVQDVFVRVWDKLHSFRGGSAFSTWLHRVAVNTVIENLRVKARWRDRHDAAADPEAQADHGFATLAGTDIDLERAIMRLPVQARLVFVLHDVEGNKHREVAALTGLAVGTCKAHLHRARQLLREILGNEAMEVLR